MRVEEYDDFVAETADTISIHSFRFIRLALWPEAILTPMYFGEGLSIPEYREVVIYTSIRGMDIINKAIKDSMM